MYFWISTAVYSLVWLLSPQTVRLLLLGLTILGGVLWLFWGGKRRKDKRALYTVCLLLLLAGAGRFLNTPVAQLKFFCLEGMYRQTAQSLCAELREDGDFGFRMDLQGPSFLSNAGQVQALAENGTLALYFPSRRAFSIPTAISTRRTAGWKPRRGRSPCKPATMPKSWTTSGRM